MAVQKVRQLEKKKILQIYRLPIDVSVLFFLPFILDLFRLLYMMGLRKVDPSTERFNEIFSAAANGSAAIPSPADGQPKKVSAWPIITFLGLIFATPYLIMKLIGQVSTTAIEQCKWASNDIGMQQ